MADPLLPPRTPFPFRDTFFGRIRAFLHSFVGRWVETHHVEQQNEAHRQIERQYLDLVALITKQDHEIAQLKRMVAQLGGELGSVTGRLAKLEGLEPVALVQTDESVETAEVIVAVNDAVVARQSESDSGAAVIIDERVMLAEIDQAEATSVEPVVEENVPPVDVMPIDQELIEDETPVDQAVIEDVRVDETPVDQALIDETQPIDLFDEERQSSVGVREKPDAPAALDHEPAPDGDDA